MILGVSFKFLKKSSFKKNVCFAYLIHFFFLFTVPPDKIEIVDHPAGSRVKIRENEEVELTCKVSNAKPKADIVWYRKDSQFVTGTCKIALVTK